MFLIDIGLGALSTICKYIPVHANNFEKKFKSYWNNYV